MFGLYLAIAAALVVPLWAYSASRGRKELQLRWDGARWLDKYHSLMWLEHSHTSDGLTRSWSADLKAMTLRLTTRYRSGDANWDPDPDPEWNYTLQRTANGTWFQQETPGSWATELWRLKKHAEGGGLLAGEWRRRVRTHLRTRPDWERVDDELATALERHHQAFWRHLAVRPPRAAGDQNVRLAAVLESVAAEELSPDFAAKVAQFRVYGASK